MPILQREEEQEEVWNEVEEYFVRRKLWEESIPKYIVFWLH